MPTVDIDDRIIEFAYVEAIKDATMQRAFPHNNKSKLWDKNSNVYVDIIDYFLNNKNLIKQVLNGYYQNIASNNYDTDFKNTCSDVCKIINGYMNLAGNAPFGFGNAQKLINMMLKYLYICTIYNRTPKDYFKHCHCPMDSVTKNVAWAYIKNNYPGTTKPNWAKESWSRISVKDYMDFQIDIKNKLCPNYQFNNASGNSRDVYPLECDYCIW